MAKKLQGDLFLLSANDLKTGNVLFYSTEGWCSEAKRAVKKAA